MPESHSKRAAQKDTEFTVDGARRRLHDWATRTRNASKKAGRLRMANDVYAVLHALDNARRIGWDAHIEYEKAQARHFLAGFAAGPEPEKPDYARE